MFSIPQNIVIYRIRTFLSKTYHLTVGIGSPVTLHSSSIEESTRVDKSSSGTTNRGAFPWPIFFGSILAIGTETNHRNQQIEQCKKMGQLTPYNLWINTKWLVIKLFKSTKLLFPRLYKIFFNLRHVLLIEYWLFHKYFLLHNDKYLHQSFCYPLQLMNRFHHISFLVCSVQMYESKYHYDT